MTSHIKFKCWSWTNKAVEWTVNAPEHAIVSQDAFIVVSAQYWFPQVRGHAIAEAVVCFLLWRPGLIPRLVQGQFAVGKVAVRQAFPQVLWYYCASCEATSVTVIISGTIGPFEAIVPRYLVSPLSHNHDKRVQSWSNMAIPHIFIIYRDMGMHVLIHLTGVVYNKMYWQC